MLFAGVPYGNRVALPLDDVYLGNLQFTGCSGSTLADELRVLAKAQAGQLSPSLSVTAIGGMRAVAQGIQAVMERSYPGKIVIFPQLLDLPLLGLADLAASLPDVHACLGPGATWTAEAERVLFEQFLPSERM
jgi:hypothetical protein